MLRTLIDGIGSRYDEYRTILANQNRRISMSFVMRDILNAEQRNHNKTLYRKIMQERLKAKFNEGYLRAMLESLDFISKYFKGLPDLAREDLLEYAAGKVTLDGVWAEFGVFKGYSLNIIASLTRNIVHGFDSFDGLPEDWTQTMKKGAFRISEKDVLRLRKNVKLHKGLFSDTLPEFKEENEGKFMAFLHVDCDLYSSAKTVLTTLKPMIKPGTVILFDEYYNYEMWKDHEYKAFMEFVKEAGLNFQYLGYNSNGEQVAVVIV